MSSRALGIVSPSPLRRGAGTGASCELIWRSKLTQCPGIGSLRPAMDDLAIRGGLVVDGTGAPGREADVFVGDERIVAIERGAGRTARRTIDARGQVVAPGFIDIHTHSDFTLPLNPRAEGKIRQGVTTEVVGNCGFSVAPALPGTSALLGDYLGASAPGLPSGLFTAPGSFAGPDEILTLARVLARYRATYASHVRDEANHGFEAVREAIAVAEATGIHVQIAHLKLSGTDNWGRARSLLAEIEAARDRGLKIDCDQYPYDTGTNPLRNLLPGWVQEGGVPAMLERLAQPAIRGRIREDLARDGLNNFGRIPSWDVVRIAASPSQPADAGRNFGEIARRRGIDPLAAVCDVLLDDRGHTRILIRSMTEEDVDEITRTPWVLVGSDGNALAPYGVTGQGKPHPRYYGTFARVLGYCVRERGLLTLPQAVRKMTGGSAAALGLADRGELRPGAWADLTVFDPDTIAA